MKLPTALVVDRARALRLVAVGGLAWSPAMLGLCLFGFGLISFALGVALGLFGAVATAGAIGARTIRPRRRPLGSHTQLPMPDGSAWRQLANPRDNHAHRWAMYEDLSEWLAKQDWTGKAVAEFGGTNEILKMFVPGADYKVLSYPDHDLQNLHGVEDNAFHLVILDQTLEHIPDPERALGEVRRVLKRGGVAIVTTPFLVPVHQGYGYGDYYRWTPQGLAVTLQRAGFDSQVRMWGNRQAATVLMEDMYMSAEAARRRGLAISSSEHVEGEFPITVWALATARKD